MTQRNRPLWLLAPGGMMMLLIIVIPLLIGLYIALIDLDQYTLRQWMATPFVGLANFIEAITETSLLKAIWLSVSYSVLSTLLTVPLGVAAAAATQNHFRGRGIVRSLFLIPYVMPAFVVATVWQTIFQPDGILNQVLNTQGTLWLNGPNSYWALVIAQVWSAWPFIYLMSLAGLQSVDHEVHEAAALDGAMWWKKLRYVVFPYLRGPVALACLIGTLHHINNFTLPFVLFGVPTPIDVEVLPILTYVTAFQSLRFGLSAAMAIVSLVLIMIPLFIYLRAVKLDTTEEPGGTK
ncbi:ABC transporter permease [Pseudarthrobacter sulfonivorans]|uniref:ABC transporter permease n=1 Tax=Pseudarthrobacter sulfonivorans TaxID=121292 RepID=A0A0U3FXU0_9MICC|nr:ABC transporter permease [Pseudarthrobacter sulfonivorans]